MSGPLLQVRHLRKSFGGIDALADVSFDLDAGQMLALIGPNGAGKSTCFNALGGQLRPDAGSVRLDGHELVGLACLLYTSPSPRDVEESRMPSSA